MKYTEVSGRIYPSIKFVAFSLLMLPQMGMTAFASDNEKMIGDGVKTHLESMLTRMNPTNANDLIKPVNPPEKLTVLAPPTSAKNFLEPQQAQLDADKEFSMPELYLISLQQQLTEKEKVLAEKSSTLQNQQAEIEQNRQALESQLTALHEQLAEQGKALAEKSSALQLQKAEIEKDSAALELQFNAFNELLAEKNKLLAEKSDALQRQKAEIEKDSSTLASQLTLLHEQLAEEKKLLAEKTSALQQQAQQETEIANKKSDSSLEAQLAELRSQLAEKEKLLIEKDQRLVSQESRTNPNPEEMNSYALGTLLGEDVQHLLAGQYSQKIKLDNYWVLQGLNDTVQKNIRVEKEALAKSLAAVDEILQQELLAQKSKAESAGISYQKSFLAKPGVKKDDTGFLYQINSVGTGKIRENDMVKVAIKESLVDGTITSDMDTTGEYLTQPLSQFSAVFRKALMKLQNHGVMTVVVPPELAYGEQGMLPLIPPNSTIRYDIRIINVTKGNK